MLSLALPRLWSDLKHVILLDSDVQFQTDVLDIWYLFDEFISGQIVGIAHEMQPVYRHVFNQYRSENPGR